MAAQRDQFNSELHEDDTPDSSTIYRVEAQNGTSDGTTFISYTGLALAGKGSFGEVLSADLTEGGRGIIAIKRTRQDARYKNRELAIMQRTSEDRHPNIIKLRFYYHELVPDPTTGVESLYLNMVLEFYPETIFRTSRDYMKQNAGHPLPELLVKLYTYQIFRGVAYLHSMGVCHRDIKPQNILVDPASGTLKIIDFGSAKILKKNQVSVAYTCSRFYRAPELLVGTGSMYYTNAIDIWSIGCIIAELLLGKVMFSGANSMGQLVEVIQVLGTPTESQLRAMNPNARIKHKFAIVEAQDLREKFPDSTAEAIDLLRCCWTYSPDDRIQAIESLAHCFYDELRWNETPALRLPNGKPFPRLFDWSKRELSVRSDLVRALVPERERERLLSREGIDVDRFEGEDLSRYMLQLD